MHLDKERIFNGVHLHKTDLGLTWVGVLYTQALLYTHIAVWAAATVNLSSHPVSVFTVFFEFTKWYISRNARTRLRSAAHPSFSAFSVHRFPLSLSSFFYRFSILPLISPPEGHARGAGGARKIRAGEGRSYRRKRKGEPWPQAADDACRTGSRSWALLILNRSGRAAAAAAVEWNARRSLMNISRSRVQVDSR